jgi:hypothetical protein
VCRRLAGAAIDRNSFWHNNEFSFSSLMMVDIFIWKAQQFFHVEEKVDFAKNPRA